MKGSGADRTPQGVLAAEKHDDLYRKMAPFPAAHRPTLVHPRLRKPVLGALEGILVGLGLNGISPLRRPGLFPLGCDAES
jgi:hypothetical protein